MPEDSLTSWASNYIGGNSPQLGQQSSSQPSKALSMVRLKSSRTHSSRPLLAQSVCAGTKKANGMLWPPGPSSQCYSSVWILYPGHIHLEASFSPPRSHVTRHLLGRPFHVNQPSCQPHDSLAIIVCFFFAALMTI